MSSGYFLQFSPQKPGIGSNLTKNSKSVISKRPKGPGIKDRFIICCPQKCFIWIDKAVQSLQNLKNHSHHPLEINLSIGCNNCFLLFESYSSSALQYIITYVITRTADKNGRSYIWCSQPLGKQVRKPRKSLKFETHFRRHAIKNFIKKI